jgi:release factor glutamine methyltransferase
MDLKANVLLQLGEFLRSNRYRFTTITPASHSLILKRRPPESPSLRDIFGWNWAFKIEDIDPSLKTLIEGVLQKTQNGLYKSQLRFSTVGELLFAHSAFPTREEESVFFGPDTYRFIRFLQAKIKNPVSRAIDLGTGTGAGGLSIRNFCRELVLSDLTDEALEFTQFNLKLNHSATGAKMQVVKSDLFEKVGGTFDLVIANPPFIADSGSRKYRDGGLELGLEMTKKMIEHSLPRLNCGGRLLLYTGVSIQSGKDALYDYLGRSGEHYQVAYEEIDPDIFGEELAGENYQGVDRIAAVGLTVERKL